MKAKSMVLSAIVFILVADMCTADEQVVVISWNTESGGADPDTVAARMAAMEDVDLWGLCEVKDSNWASDFRTGAENGEPGDFTYILGTTGGSDRLLILYDEDQFDKIGSFEIGWQDRNWYTPDMKPRSALVALLRHKATAQEFFFVVNHLYRGSGVDPRRLDQATGLCEWARKHTIPIIAVGDYNFDWDLDPEDAADNYKKGFGHMTAGGIFTWLVPRNMVKTHDSHYNSILDFVFLSNARGKISGTSRIIVEGGDFPDDENTPDHRPVEAKLTFKDAAAQDTIKAEVLKSIADMQSKLWGLRNLAIQLPDE